MHTITQYESNLVPIPLLQPAEGTLTEAFSSFIRAANVLEGSYRNLQDEVGRLRLELQESNCDLARSLRENEQMRIYLGGIVESLPCGVIVLDRAGRPKMLNHEANTLLSGQSAENLKVLAAAVRQKAGSEYDYSIESAQGQRNISVKRAALAPAGDAGTESVIIVSDVTEKRKLEREREDHRKMQALAEISAMLAHEIRNPLASMELFASLLADTLAADSEEMDWVRQMQAGFRLLAATVNNVLQFYSEAKIQLFPVDLHELMQTTIGLLQPIAQQHEIEIVFESEVSNAHIDADTHKLQQVCFNLAVNAFRAMQPGQTLTIALERSKESNIKIEFRDQGCGIAPNDMERIFQPGFSRSAKGPGLGLAVCRRIVEQHGGTISVLSAPAVGSTFTLEFPVVGEGQ